MKNNQIQAADFPTFLDDIATHRSTAEMARGQVLIAAWRGLVNLFSASAARINRVNRVASSEQSTA